MGIVTILASYSSVSLSLEDDALDLSEILVFEANGDYRSALERLNTLKSEHPENDTLSELELRLLIASNRLHDASKLAQDLPLTHPLKAQFEQASETAINRVVRNEKIAIIVIQKRIELQDFDSAILVADRALTRFPDRQADLFTLKGEALYKRNDLEAAETEFRRALQIDPLNPVAKSYVTEIRTTLEAQTSTALAEWISIAKDKTGDFVVTFLALFTAFLVNSLLSPLSMRYRLARARSAFDAGNYDDFADAVERLLDQEDFKPLRQNFRLLMRKRP